MIARIVLFAAASLAAASVFAQEARLGLYVYGSVGLSSARTDGAAIQSRVDAAVGPGATYTKDTDRYAGKFLLGYRFNKYFGIEGGYADVAKIHVEGTGPGGTFDSTSKLRGLQMAAVAFLPASAKLSLLLKVGGAAVHTTYKPSVGANQKSNDLQTFFGVGLQYDFSNDLFGRVEYERYSKFGNTYTGDVSANVASLGVGYKF
jgi:opacity protein-like surface antigen